MNNKRNTYSVFGMGIAVIAVGIAASARPAAAQVPLLFHPAQVRQAFGDWNHDSNWNRDHDRNRDEDRNRDRDQERRRVEQERREAERIRHEAEVRHEQWLRDHRFDRDWNRDDSHRDWEHDNR